MDAYIEEAALVHLLPDERIGAGDAVEVISWFLRRLVGWGRRSLPGFGVLSYGCRSCRYTAHSNPPFLPHPLQGVVVEMRDELVHANETDEYCRLMDAYLATSAAKRVKVSLCRSGDVAAVEHQEARKKNLRPASGPACLAVLTRRACASLFLISMLQLAQLGLDDGGGTRHVAAGGSMHASQVCALPTVRWMFPKALRRGVNRSAAAAAAEIPHPIHR